ncbi:TPA: Na+/H+ antiporter NhaA [Legionella pneumophila subsp. pneumophila]|uniref:Na+/H+ antiporter NhaA n=1 Tax=Legionella pneumophila TaxID=446 RepID=UPI0005B219E6|nr:Na+/H+ antiporter NhaA [Legionella pneumophila]HAT8849179.1 Na+/H+ antiporter NhaA [Legionella pneumophila subsp. pneumophila]CZH57037.1 Sodium/proton antiporter nhaA [Legionella pneumophila]CZH83734.1 Sodium/proton antiporter nhaA [Legionella pneumophila]HAT8368995.1 Na+/H+ antiporter NhaA [Legionella pneumophila]HAT8623366.1 Na+/H+ antiporter NhaA [Legionella pneumophila]
MNKSDSFYNLETIGGILLFIATVLAIITANSPYRVGYEYFLSINGSVSVGNMSITKPLLLWINDGLMAIYFLLIGLEIKREVNRGILSDKTNLLVPALTALAGLLFPALIFIFFNAHHPVYLKGWAIPTATDIAFTLGIVSLLGSRVPFSLKILLTAIAIFDDIAAIVIIALFYTEQLSLLSLSLALVFTLILIGLNYFKCRRISVFMLFGVALWIAVLKSGVHATLAGIVIAMTIPDEGKESMLTRLEDGLHHWVVFLILPLFAFANAGVSFVGLDASMLTHPVVLGIGLGLFLGKQLGIFLSLGYFVQFKKFLKADKVNLAQVYGIALICGVGFTMSLFIGSLAYQNYDLSLMPMVKIGVVFGSFIAGLTGFLVLKMTSLKR